MGVSTNAYLFYGFSFDEGEFERIREEYEEQNNIDFEGDPQNYILYMVGGKELMDADYETREKALEELGIEIQSHCSSSYPIYYISAKEYRTTRGDTNRIPSTLSTPGEEFLMTQKIKSFCELIKYDLQDKEIGWYLVSYWSN